MKKNMPSGKLRTLIPMLAPASAFRSKLLIGFAIVSATVGAVISCQKKFSITDECILDFQLQHPDGKMFESEQVGTKITADSVFVQVTETADITSVYPKITFIGAAVWPQQNILQDFSHPCRYTVAGEDGTTRTYVVLVTKVK
ncbi:MAG TPA: hypothetical protein VHB48_11775 [Chitinophagaceae bacterium]|nr:hypothetical protein [Chitinophagaceae bacterium]